ncbi:flagellar hook-basal body complex protein FliE [Bremerella cremea]|uniref:Flagellar hook-basal body complex protein FliE n=1 Tax=Bremerella cremea TaxID=1031537 RepID=A0A368KKS9_9BACT|nr:flagellar hook-basal body complex protein FliE [Bremerella cremea]RCS41381.1 flagellar hook-basal body complex protein FliE [Bremerella cremea]
MTSINAIQQQLNLPQTPNILPGKQEETPESFGKFLLKGIQEVNQMQQDADRAVESLFTGGDVNPAEVLSAVQKADMSFKMMLQVRNKMMQAYTEVKDIRI